MVASVSVQRAGEAFLVAERKFCPTARQTRVRVHAHLRVCICQNVIDNDGWQTIAIPEDGNR